MPVSAAVTRDWLKTASAFDCVPIQGLRNERGVEIGTPFSYADGTAIVLYAMEEGDRILLSDNGEMLAHLATVGIQTSRRLASLRERVDRFGLTLTAKGDVRALVPTDQGAHMLATAISAMLSVANWERDLLGLDEQTRNLADEAETLLREWKPGAAMRKAGDVKNSPYLAGQDIRVIVDDRRDPQRADVERQIPGSLVKALTLTKLQRLARPSRIQ